MTVLQSELSPRERDCLQGLARGLVYKQIAHELGISVSTVRTHLHQVYNKLGMGATTDRAQAVLIAVSKDLIDPPEPWAWAHHAGSAPASPPTGLAPVGTGVVLTLTEEEAEVLRQVLEAAQQAAGGAVEAAVECALDRPSRRSAYLAEAQSAVERKDRIAGMLKQLPMAANPEAVYAA